MTEYLTLPFKKSALVARVMAMTAKASELTASQEGESAKRVGLVQKATSSQEDLMLLKAALRSAIDSFFVFIAGEAFGIQHITDTLSDDSDDFMIEMDRPPRFNEAMRQPLVSQAGDFIVRSMLFSWYSAFSSEVAQQQAAVLPQLQLNIARCFRKTDSSPLAWLFPTEVRLDRISIPEFIVTGETFNLLYEVRGSSDSCLNDIEVVTEGDRDIVRCTVKNDHIVVDALAEGTVTITARSHHNTAVADTVTFTVTPYV